MARITVEDCLEKVDNQYDLVLLAKERTSQLNTGVAPEVPEENDKKTVISLREIGEGKVSIQDLEDSAINKLREHPEDAISSEDFDSNEGDEFDKLYKGEISKSGAAVLPSKRVRKISDKIILNNKETFDTKKEDENISEASKDQEKNLDEKSTTE
jgi:DNA-directed RNA polymerase subunit omega